jgi:hypothetical protein
MAVIYTSIALKTFAQEKVDVKLVAAIEQKALKHNVQKCCGLHRERQP